MDEKDFIRTEELLTPKFRRFSNVDFSRKKDRWGQKRRIGWWKWTGIAAMLALVITVGLPYLMPANAEVTVAESLDQLKKSDTYRVEFTLLVQPSNGNDVYKAHPTGTPMSGIAYIKYVDGVTKLRCEWNDDEKTIEIYDGKTYKCFRNGNLITSYASTSVMNINEMLDLNMAKEKIKDLDLKIVGDTVKLVAPIKENNGEITGCFLRSNNRLVKASMIYKGKDIFVTHSIDYGMDIADTIF